MAEHDFYQVSLKVFLRNKAGQVLALKAANRGTMVGYFDFPGGRIDVDEFSLPFPEIISRELREEIGPIEFHLNTKPVAVGRHKIPSNLSSDRREKHVLYVFFEADYLGGVITVSHEHTGFQWIDLSQAELDKFFISGNLEGVWQYLESRISHA